jgi:putative membrane protein
MAAWPQGSQPQGVYRRMTFQDTLTNLTLSVLFAVLGFILLFVGYRIFDMLTPTDLNKRIFEDGNSAAAILAGAFVLGLAIIVAMAIN